MEKKDCRHVKYEVEYKGYMQRSENVIEYGGSIQAQLGKFIIETYKAKIVQ